MKYVIWGAGERGARIFPHLKENEIKAFIDIDDNKIGKEYFGKKIISFEEYKEKYSECYIIITYMHEEEISGVLEENGIQRFFLLSECPGEFQESYPRDVLKKYILNYMKSKKKFLIYGCTLYTVLLCKWIEEKYKIYAKIIPHSNMNKKLLGILAKDMKEHKFYTLEDLQKMDVDEVLVTVEQELKVVQKNSKQNIKVTNIYDCSDDIAEYYNPLIEKFKGIHSGKRCFIVATGPSLRMEDLDTLLEHQEICISVNSIWKAFSKTLWRPMYYVAMDYRALADIKEDSVIPYLFLGDTDKNYWMKPHKENYMKHHFVYEYNEKRYPKFSEDFARKSYMGSTVTYNALQLAVYMGFQEIYLLGVDFSYAGQEGKYAHFYREKKLIATGFEKQVRLAYLSTREYADQHGIKIYNATRGGKLEIFERIDFDELFK